MILVDPTVWIGHLRRGDAELASLFQVGQVLAHPCMTGEIALGHLSRRSEILGLLNNLPRAMSATDLEVLTLIDTYQLFGLGIGYIEAPARLWIAERAPPYLDNATPDAPFTISEPIVPDRIDSPDAADFIAMAEVRNIVEAEQRGTATEVATAAEMPPSWKDESSAWPWSPAAACALRSRAAHDNDRRSVITPRVMSGD